MRILSINAVPYGSTARICLGITEVAQKSSIEMRCAFGYSYHPIKTCIKWIKIGGVLDKVVHICLSKLTGLPGFFSVISTIVFLFKVKKISPDLIHLHNIHGWYINIPLLIKYINKWDIDVVFTMHDCWSFTGHCTHFDMIGCDKWKIKCDNCPQYKNYPSTIYDNSAFMYGKKKQWFQSLQKLHIVTPSNWLASKVSESFLANYNISIINNGINLSIFKPSNNKYFYHEYGIKDKTIILGVSFGWSYQKGLDVYIKLANILDENYQIVLVGTSKQSRQLIPNNIIAIDITQSQEELAQIYSSSDVFLNCTREENFPTVNIEALACGLPVITFNTGGSPEIIDDHCGYVVEKDDIDGIIEKLEMIRKFKPFSVNQCRSRALKYDMYEKFEEYVNLYKKILG